MLQQEATVSVKCIKNDTQKQFIYNFMFKQSP